MNLFKHMLSRARAPAPAQPTAIRDAHKDARYFVREIERLQNVVEGRQGSVAAAVAAKDSAEIRIALRHAGSEQRD